MLTTTVHERPAPGPANHPTVPVRPRRAPPRRRAGALLPPLALALLAAIPRLTNPLAIDPFVDEAYWVHWAVDRFDPRNPATLWHTLAVEGRPPLHYWLLVLTTGLADNAFLAGRIGAALPSIGSTVALYALGRTLVSPLVGIISGVLWALSPFSVFFARIASSDDSTLTFCAIMVALTAVALVRRPGPRTGAVCGVWVGLAVMAKTLGLLAAATPVLAVLTLVQPRAYRRLVRPALAAVIATALVVSPLVPWLPQLSAKVAIHAGLPSIEASVTDSQDAEAPTAGGPVAAEPELPLPDRFRRNLDFSLDVLRHYLGLPMLLLAAAALGLILVQRQRGLLFLALVAVLGFAVMMATTTTPFSRYLLSSTFPLYILAAAAITRFAEAVAGRLRSPSLRPRLAAGLLVAGLAVPLAPMLPFTFRLVSDPWQAPFPPIDRWQYFEQWLTLNGLREVAGFLQNEARDGPVTVLVPRASSEMRVVLPHQALRLYLRDDPAVRFVEEPTIWRAQSFRDLRTWVRADSPTFLVVNGTHGPNAGSPDYIPEYTRRVEVALARDLPQARAVLHIPRPTGPSWLTVYRIDQGRSGPRR